LCVSGADLMIADVAVPETPITLETG
jgi:hypothetical protein